MIWVLERFGSFGFGSRKRDKLVRHSCNEAAVLVSGVVQGLGDVTLTFWPRSLGDGIRSCSSFYK